MASLCTRLIRRVATVSVAITLFAALLGNAAGAGSSSGLVSIGAGLKGRSNLSATVAVEGLENVSALAFDDDGRLWALAAAFEDDGTDALYVVTSTGSTPVVVVTGLHTPMGLLWHEGWLYVASGTTVEAYRGFDGTQFTEHRTVVSLPDGVGLLGGLAVDSQGRISLGVSAPCDACTPESEYSATILSFLPVTSASADPDLRVDVRGVRAPVGLAYFPGTDDLFVTMNQRDDLGEATPGDWLALVTDGEDWGFPECYGQRSRTCADAGDVVAELDRHAAASGVAFVGTSAFVAEWTRGKVVRVALAPSASGYRATKITTWVKGIGNPVAVVVGPDGAVYVGDWSTGTVYRIAERPES